MDRKSLIEEILLVDSGCATGLGIRDALQKKGIFCRVCEAQHRKGIYDSEDHSMSYSISLPVSPGKWDTAFDDCNGKTEFHDGTWREELSKAANEVKANLKIVEQTAHIQRVLDSIVWYSREYRSYCYDHKYDNNFDSGKYKLKGINDWAETFSDEKIDVQKHDYEDNFLLWEVYVIKGDTKILVYQYRYDYERFVPITPYKSAVLTYRPGKWEEYLLDIEKRINVILEELKEEKQRELEIKEKIEGLKFQPIDLDKDW